ncbi:hypothetical protein CQJ30_06025 [Caldibacillus thermoamylovorans]|uniref:hypothetical protein n=1 Tax=Caldibacillus thermoamylovorans TaxID=35841 RepID=UPI000D560261|nr:hypothetical protein [Caldibacillus thermoamylovorans]AWI11755.1 hypothetical protein CQJ30_06025 [Caldibacillus thermoamylovorans]
MEVSLYPAQTVIKSSPMALEKSKMERRKISSRKCPIGSTNHQWDEESPLMEVSLYPAQTVIKSSPMALEKIKDGKEEDKFP